MKFRHSLMMIFLWHLSSSGSNGHANSKDTIQRENINDVVQKIYWLAREPKNISVKKVEEAFPGKYKVYQCDPAETFCARQNQDQAKPLRLNTYVINKGEDREPKGGSLTFFFPKGEYCLRQEQLAQALHNSGKRPSSPILREPLPSSTYNSELLEYRGVNATHPEVVISATSRNDCIIEITLDAILNN